MDFDSYGLSVIRSLFVEYKDFRFIYDSFSHP